VYFDNDQEAYAAFNALKLKELISSAKAVKSKAKI
jgi:hypothetical protein